MSYSKLSNAGELRAAARPVGRARPGRAWSATRRGSARPSTASSRTARTASRRANAGGADGRGRRRWRPQEFPSTAVSETWRRLARMRMLPNWYGRSASTRRRHRTGLRVRVRRRHDHRLHRPHRPDRSGSARASPTTRPAGPYNAASRTRACSWASTTSRCRRPRTWRRSAPVTGVELAFLKGHYKTGDIEMREWEWARRARGRVPAADARAALGVDRRSPPAGRRGAVPAELARGLLLLRLQDAVLAVSAGRAVVLRRTADRDASATYPPGDRRRDGRPPADGRAVARHLEAARALRAGRRRRVGQDVGDGRARGVPGARRARSHRAPITQGVLPGNVLA